MIYARAPSFEILCIENDLRFSFYEPRKEAVDSFPSDDHRIPIPSALFIPFELPRCPSFEILSADNEERFSFYHAGTSNRSQEEIVALREQDDEETQSRYEIDDDSSDKGSIQEKMMKSFSFEQKNIQCEEAVEDSSEEEELSVLCAENESDIVLSSTSSRQKRFSFYEPEAREPSPMPTYYVNENFQLASEFAQCKTFDILDPDNEERFSFYDALDVIKHEEDKNACDEEKKQSLIEAEEGKENSNTANISVDEMTAPVVNNEETISERVILNPPRQTRFRFYEPAIDHHTQKHIVDIMINEREYEFARCPTFEILSHDNKARFSFYDTCEVKKIVASEDDNHSDEESTSKIEDSCSIFEDERIDEPAEVFTIPKTSSMESYHSSVYKEERAPSVCDDRNMIDTDSFGPSNAALRNKNNEQYLTYSLSEVARVYGNKMEEDAECMSCYSDHNEGKDSQIWAIQSKTEIAALQNFIDRQIVEGQGSISFDCDISQSFSIGTTVPARNIDNLINAVDDFCSRVEVRIDNIMKDTDSYDE